MVKISEKIPAGFNVFGKKSVELTYRDYCAHTAENDAKAVPMPFAEFSKIVDTARSEKEAYDKLTFNAAKLQKLEEKGWNMQLHTSASGPNKGVPTKYLVNDEAKANGDGFLTLNRTRLEETRRRFLMNVDAIDILLAD